MEVAAAGGAAAEEAAAAGAAPWGDVALRAESHAEGDVEGEARQKSPIEERLRLVEERLRSPRLRDGEVAADGADESGEEAVSESPSAQVDDVPGLPTRESFSAGFASLRESLQGRPY